MDYCFLKGFLVILLIQQSTSEDLSTSIQSSTAVTLQDDQALPPWEPELAPAEAAPVVAPPSLKEVQQAVQEASEQVEVHGAEEVLKGLLERVVEAALGQVEAEAKAEEPSVQDAVKEDPPGDDKGENEPDAEAEVLLEQEAEEETGGADIGAGEEQAVVGVDALEEVAQEAVETGAVEEETTADVETGITEAEGVEVVDESLDANVGLQVTEESVAALEEVGGQLTVEETEVEDNENQVGLSETATLEAEGTQAIVDVAAGGEPEQAVVEPILVKDHIEPLGAEVAPGQETQIDELEGEAIVPPFVSYEMESTQSVVGEPMMEEEEVNIVKDAEGGPADEQGHLVVVGGAAVQELEGDGADLEAAEGEVAIAEDSVASVNDGGDQQAGEEEQIALETSLGSEKEEQDGADGSIEQVSDENPVPTPGPSLGGGAEEIGGHAHGEEQHANEIITTTDDLLPLDPVEPRPTLDNFVKDVLAQTPEAEGEEPGEANELVEDKAGTADTSELGLEAWKIAAISAAVFLVLETVFMIIYILKCRSKNSNRALQRACEDGCVEPEAATGGDCSDDTLPAGNGDAQQIAAFDPSDVASTLAQNQEQTAGDGHHAIAMSDFPPGSTEESANPSQDLRTSIL